MGSSPRAANESWLDEKPKGTIHVFSILALLISLLFRGKKNLSGDFSEAGEASEAKKRFKKEDHG